MFTLSSPDIKETADSYKDLAQDILLVGLPKANDNLLDAIERNATATELLRLQEERLKMQRRFNDCTNKALELDAKSLSGALQSVDIGNALNVINCSTGKAKLAIQRLDDIRAMLVILTAFLELGAELTSAAATGGIAHLKPIIEKVDDLVNTELKRSLTESEIQEISNELAQCLPNS
jgi:hypothetical protein